MDSLDSPLAEFQHYNELLLLLDGDCDADDGDSLCLPPLFDLPPPPPPPWLEMPPLCDNCVEYDMRERLWCQQTDCSYVFDKLVSPDKGGEEVRLETIEI